MNIFSTIAKNMTNDGNNPSLDDKQYSPNVRVNRQETLLKGFDPEGIDYDYTTAEKIGMLPETMGGNKNHMGSVAPVTPEIYEQYKKHGLPSGESYILLKGASHPTHEYAVKGEAERGFEIKKYGDRYFSVPKQTQSIESILNFINEKQIIPKFNLTPEQEKAFAGTQYGKIEDKTPLKQSILARILTGDQSAGKITPMQQKWADWVQSQLPQQ
jgi:hypothetical protein